MPKLSDVFLNLLGNTLQGMGGLTPTVKAELALRQAQSARENINTQTGLANSFNTVAPGTPTANPQGSFQVNPQDASLTGLVPGTTYQPIQRTATTPFITPGSKPGSATVAYSSRPLQRGEVTEPAVNTLGPYGAMLLGQQKIVADQATSYRTAANAALTQMTNLTSKEDPGIMTSIMQGVMPQLSSIKDQSVAAALPQLFQIYKDNKDRADQLSSQITNPPGFGNANPASSGNPGGGASAAGVSSPVLGGMTKIQGSDKKQWNIPTANLGAARMRDPGLVVVN